MSRTYRTHEVIFCDNCHKPDRWIASKVVGMHSDDRCKCYENHPWDTYSAYGSYRKFVKVHDHKPWYKPPKEFKQMRRRQFRAQSKRALHDHVYKGREYTPPINKKSDVWNWT